jgi:hypothetical protein
MTKSAYAPNYAPNFAQALDRSRPRTLLTARLETAGHLQYRYQDTGKTVTVPNTWYNQPVEARVEHWRRRADEHDVLAARLMKDPPVRTRRADASKWVDRLNALAWVCRKVAEHLENEREAVLFQDGDLYKQFSEQQPVLEE